MTQICDEVIRKCWELLAQGHPLQALERAEGALRSFRPATDSPFTGRLLLVIGVSLKALGRREAASRYLQEASWALDLAGQELDPEGLATP